MSFFKWFFNRKPKPSGESELEELRQRFAAAARHSMPPEMIEQLVADGKSPDDYVYVIDPLRDPQLDELLKSRGGC